jgi:hypothetical protein
VGLSYHALILAHWSQCLVSPCLSLAVLDLAVVLPVPTSVSNVRHSFAISQSLAHTVSKGSYLLNVIPYCPTYKHNPPSFFTPLLHVNSCNKNQKSEPNFQNQLTVPETVKTQNIRSLDSNKVLLSCHRHYF